MIFPADRLILAHHGTAGACRAEELAFALLGDGKGQLIHLWVVPDFWAGMQGDDWLNNASTRQEFARYVEKMLADEAARWVDRLRQRASEQGVEFSSTVRFGDPTEEVLRLTEQEKAPLVLGPRRKRGFSGFRSRVDIQKLTSQIKVPLFIAAPLADGS